jgi:hypothetical protein
MRKILIYTCVISFRPLCRRSIPKPRVMRSSLPGLLYLLAKHYSLERNFAENEHDDTATMVVKESITTNPVEVLPMFNVL